MNKFELKRYYTYFSGGSTVLKCIDEEENIYFFERVDDGSFSSIRCNNYNESSRLCKKCNEKAICSKTLYNTANLIEIPRLKAILLYEKV